MDGGLTLHYIDIVAIDWAVVVAQLNDRSLLRPEEPGSNPDIGKFYSLLSGYGKDKNIPCIKKGGLKSFMPGYRF